MIVCLGRLHYTYNPAGMIGDRGKLEVLVDKVFSRTVMVKLEHPWKSPGGLVTLQTAGLCFQSF